MKFRLHFLFAFLLLLGSLTVQAQATFSKQNGVLGLQYKGDPWVPLSSTNTGGVSTSVTAAITANANSITAAQTARIENKSRLDDFIKAIIDYVTAPAGKIIPIAWYGDSVSPAVAAEFIRQLNTFLPVGGGTAPGVGVSLLGTAYTTTGVVKYALNTSGAEQSCLNGVMTPTSITRSGSTATVTLSSNRASVGGYITVLGAAQSEYNGTFLITAVSGPAVVPATVSYAITGTPASPATGSISVYGTQNDFTYLPSASHVELTNGAVLTTAPTFQFGRAQWKTYLATGPGMGSATVDLLDAFNSSVISTTSVNLSAGALSATKVTFPLSSTIAYKVRVTASGKVVHLLSAELADNGILPLSWGVGGSSLAQQQFSSDAIFQYINNDLGTALMFVQAKTQNEDTPLPAVATRLNSLPSVSKFIINSLPDKTPASAQLVVAQMWHDFALAQRFAYMDGYAVFGSFNELCRLSYQGDSTHAARGGNALVAALALSDLDLRLPGTSVRQSVDHTGTAGTVTTSTLKINGYTAGYPAITAIYPSGGGTPKQLTYTNALEFWFGDPAASLFTPGIGTFSNGIRIKNPWGGNGPVQASLFSATGPGGSNFDGGMTVGVQGGQSSGNSTFQNFGSISQPVTSAAANIALASAQRTLKVAGTITVSLPDATQCYGREYIVIKTDAGTTLTISPSSGQTINGASNKTVTNQWQVVGLVSDGANWVITTN